MRTKLWHLLAVVALAQSGGARAQLLFDINPSIETGPPGTTVTFSGMLTNIGGSTVFLNADNFLLFGVGVTVDDTKFFANSPPSLAPRASVSAELFDAIIDASAAPGDYPGSFTVLGGASPNSQDTLASHDFLVTVTPEPGVLSLLLGLAVSGVGVALRRRRNSGRF